jgi:hypothetical protein
MNSVRPLTDTEAAYIAGYLDGDGYIGLQIKHRNDINRHAYHFHSIISFADARLKVLHWLKEKIGAGFIEDRREYGVRSLYLSANPNRWLLPQIRNYLVLKQQQADLMIQFLNLTQAVRGGKIKSELWLKNMEKYLELFLHIKCLNNDVPHELLKIKSGELLGVRESHKSYNVLGNEERDKVKKFVDSVISSRAYCGCIGYLKQWEGSTTKNEYTPTINSTVPDSKEKI